MNSIVYVSPSQGCSVRLGEFWLNEAQKFTFHSHFEWTTNPFPVEGKWERPILLQTIKLAWMRSLRASQISTWLYSMGYCLGYLKETEQENDAITPANLLRVWGSISWSKSMLMKTSVHLKHVVYFLSHRSKIEDAIHLWELNFLFYTLSIR